MPFSYRLLYRPSGVKQSLFCLGTALLVAIAAGCSDRVTSSASSEATAAPAAKSVPAAKSSPVAKTAAPTKSAAKTSGNPRAIAVNNQGVKQLSKGDAKGALQQFNQAIRLDGNLAEAYLGRGIAYSSLGKRQEAIRDYATAIRLNNRFAEAYLNRADEYAAVGNKSAAIADLKKATALFNQHRDRVNARLANDRLQSLQTPVVEAAAPQTTSSAVASSTSAEMALASYLSSIGAKMYGTYWCSSCNWQKEQFRDAMAQVPYIECDPRGANAQPDLCRQVRGYPTWEINGRLYPPGAFPLSDLAAMSGYGGSRNFGS